MFFKLTIPSPDFPITNEGELTRRVLLDQRGVDTGDDGSDGRSTHGTVCEGLGAVWAGCLVAAGSEYGCGFLRPMQTTHSGTSTSTGITSSCVEEGMESEGGEGGGWRCGGGGG